MASERNACSIGAVVCFGLMILNGVSSQRLRSKSRGRGNELLPEFGKDGGVFTFGAPSAQACDESSCYPATGNLLIGREDKLSATSTCGMKKIERFCIVSHLKERKKCFYCNSLPSQKSNVKIYHGVDSILPRSSKRKTWWQSENGVEHVSLRLDLEAEFHFTHLIITFKTFRPAAMLIERSSDSGKTWHIYQYFAYDCAESFPHVPTGPRQKITDVICDSQYSGVEPSTEGEVIFRVLPPHIHIDDPYSREVKTLLRMTNLRINFTKLHTLGDNLLDSRQEIKEKYYYSIYDMVVRGSCSCNGHASHCIADSNVETKNKRNDTVYGRCKCEHHTKGKNCNECEDFYHDQPWRPAIGRQTNACKRCECNDHANECEFNQTVWEQSGQITGGVCINCQHNTIGRNCDHCKIFYYQDPGRDIRDPHICQQCDCDARGALDDGLCDPRTDPALGLVSGSCHCKRNVDGRRCDRCKTGFWNYDENNPEGCRACHCDTLGTVGNQGCNPNSGECVCKRNVIGRDCNQCLSEHWGLSTEEDGCKPCDCDRGGSEDNNCDVITGQCRCRHNINNRRCDQPEGLFFAGALDYMVYEAELARSSEDCQVMVREPYPNRDSTWTGLGFMRVFEGSHLEFDVTDVPSSMEYDIVIRYEPQLAGQWEEVVVSVERPGSIDPSGPCANTIPRDDHKTVILPSGERYVVTYPPVCLEKDKNYKIRIDFKNYDSHTDTPSASVLIDSIVLVPRIDGIPFFHGTPQNEYAKQEYERFRCGQAYYSVEKHSPPDICKKYLYSIGFYVYGQAHACYCDATGSISTVCDTLGGQCTCKPHVVGRQCDRCAPGTYGLETEGCKPCDCNSVGSLDNFCDIGSGQCKCRPNTYGRQCDECQVGFWNYPNCQRCDCNGHADTCDSRTGLCIDCRDFTAGHKCDRCENGFYGDPRIGIDIPCRPCPCPGTAESGISHAATCELDSRTQNVLCHCHPGYDGERCDRCAQNYFGDPNVPDGECIKCDCNNNIDETTPGNCDARTGECLKCLYSTEGYHCERCKGGFYGDASRQQCLECVCNKLGTDSKEGHCNRMSGQCPCLPNIEGISCDRCALNHWKIASGEGCESCSCDSLGSYSPTCNEIDGQCTCRAGHGGRQCNDCEANYWGDPTENCFRCKCNPEGSATLQCRRNNGTCVCIEGISGDRCDQCARGYTGRAPYCDPCGECFDNWDLIIQRLKDQTLEILEAARRIKQTGVTGVFTHEFMVMEEELNFVREILASTNVTNIDIEELQKLIDELSKELNLSEANLKVFEEEMDNTTDRIFYANLALDDLRQRAKELADLAAILKENSTALQEANIEGALNITRDALKKSRAAETRVHGSQTTLEDSERQRRRTENLLSQAAGLYNDTFSKNEEALNKIADEIGGLEDQIPDINKLVCDGGGTVDVCDSLCGGAGCDKCGGLSCQNGAVTRAEDAKLLAKDTSELLTKKEKEAKELLNSVVEIKQNAIKALEEAKAAYDRAQQAKNQSENATGDIEELLERINNFLRADGARPAEIRVIAQKCLDLEISLEEDEINKLADDISKTIAGLTDIEAILKETAEDLEQAKLLKMRADLAKVNADDVLDTAKKVAEALKEAKEAQELAQRAIDKAQEDIGTAEKDLEEITTETDKAQELSDKSVDDVDELQQRLDDLKKKFFQNDRDAKKAKLEAKSADDMAQQADKDAQDLEDKYGDALRSLEEKALQSGAAKDRAERLRERARKLAEEANSKLNELRGMEDEFDENERRLKDYSGILAKMNSDMMGYLTDIEKQSNHYRDCQQ